MNVRRVLGALFVLCGHSLALGAYHLRAQQPAGGPDLSEEVAKVSLSEMGLPAGAASATRFLYKPGLSMAPHQHIGRTSIITIVKGELTERRGDVVKVYKAGDVITVAEGASHANENVGPEDLIYVEINITGTKPGPQPAAK